MAGKRANGLIYNFPKIMALSVLGLGVGFFLLEEVATWEKVPLGQVFYILAGCAFIAVSGIFIVWSIKIRFFPKKKKKRSKPIFLEDTDAKKKGSSRGV